MRAISTSPALGGLCGVALAIFINGLIFVFGVGHNEKDVVVNPGPLNEVIFTIVPFVWVFLFAAMGIAIQLLRDEGKITKTSLLALALLINCAAYPLYTSGFGSPDAGLAGNYVTALLAAIAATASWPKSRLAAFLIIPVTLWVSIASIGLYLNQTGRPF